MCHGDKISLNQNLKQKQITFSKDTDPSRTPRITRGMASFVLNMVFGENKLRGIYSGYE